MNIKRLIIVGIFHVLNIFSCNLKDNAAYRQCTYLDPEIVYRINENEIKTIVEIGSRDGLDALQLSLHYGCRALIVEGDQTYSSDIHKNISSYPQVASIAISKESFNLEDLKKKYIIDTLDLLCVDPIIDPVFFLQHIEKQLDYTKYILIPNQAAWFNTKDYLVAKGFRSYFDNISLFNHILLVNEHINNCVIDVKPVQDFNMPIPSPRIPGNINSELIYAAIENNHTPFHDLRANVGLDINYQDSNGNTALMLAAAHNSVYPVQKLLQQQNINLNLRNKNGCTALMIAAALGRVDIVKILLNDARSQTIISDNLGMTAKEIARRVRAAEIADLIDGKKNQPFDKESHVLAGYPCAVIPSTVVIGGICKDIAEYLPDAINIMEKIGNLFQDYRIVIYENNSTDGTQDILDNWMRINLKVAVHHEFLKKSELIDQIINKHDNGDLNRIELIARARNKLLDNIMVQEYSDYPYIIMMDMDFRSAPPAEGIIEVFESDREWDAVFGYGVNKDNVYWDWYAFRDFNQPFGPELLGYDWFTTKRWSLKKTDQWCPVYSAFGGFGIYKRASIGECRYSALVNEDLGKVYKGILDWGKASDHPIIAKYLVDSQQVSKKINIFSCSSHLDAIKDRSVGIVLQQDADALTWRMNSFVYQYPIVCEHVPFHASMIVHGHGKLFINPRLILTYER